MEAAALLHTAADGASSPARRLSPSSEQSPAALPRARMPLIWCPPHHSIMMLREEHHRQHPQNVSAGALSGHVAYCTSPNSKTSTFSRTYWRRPSPEREASRHSAGQNSLPWPPGSARSVQPPRSLPQLPVEHLEGAIHRRPAVRPVTGQPHGITRGPGAGRIHSAAATPAPSQARNKGLGPTASGPARLTRQLPGDLERQGLSLARPAGRQALGKQLACRP